MMSDSVSKHHDDDLMLVDDECQIVDDPRIGLSDRFEHKLVDDDDLMLVDDECQIVDDPRKELSDRFEPKLVCLDEEEKNPKGKDIPVVEEGSQVKKVLPIDVDGAAEAVNLDHDTFSLANHCFGLILSKSHLGPGYIAFLPTKTVKVLSRYEKVPVVLKSYGRIWNMFYTGNQKSKTFNCSGWGKFVTDNRLKVGDACFFELLENSPKKIVFKVVILKTAFPSRIEVVDVGTGTSAKKPIVVVD